MSKSMQKSKNPHLRWRNLIWIILVGVTLLVIYVIWKVSFFLYGFQPLEMALAQYTPKDVVGDLGGMKVLIPRYYAEYVEYDADPGFGEKRKGPRPERTFASRLRSFGIEAHFPDMKGLENAQIREEKIQEEKRRQPQPESSWIDIGINAGEDYPGDGFLDRGTSYLDIPGKYWWNNYKRLPNDEHGLEFWVVADVDPRTGKPGRESSDTYDVYIHRDASGKVDTHIRCNRTDVPRGVATCRMGFSLAPKAQVGVRVGFRRGLLPEWQKIRQSAHNLLLSFEVKETSVEESPSAPVSQ